MLNLADVPYIDSAGLGEIVRTYTTVSRQGGSLKLLNLTKRITDLLSITKLLTVFETYDNEADAVRSFHLGQRVTARFARRIGTGHGHASAQRAPRRCGPVIPRLLLVSLRPEQWTKNLLVLRRRCCSADACSNPTGRRAAPSPPS